MIVASMVATSFSSTPVIAKTSAAQVVTVRPGLTLY